MSRQAMWRGAAGFRAAFGPEEYLEVKAVAGWGD
jgi:hypothetical protein